MESRSIIVKVDVLSIEDNLFIIHGLVEREHRNGMTKRFHMLFDTSPNRPFIEVAGSLTCVVSNTGDEFRADVSFVKTFSEMFEQAEANEPREIVENERTIIVSHISLVDYEILATIGFSRECVANILHDIACGFNGVYSENLTG